MTEAKTPIQPDAVEIVEDFFTIKEVPPVINGWDPKKAMKRLWLAEALIARLIEAARKQGNMMDMMSMELQCLKAHATEAACARANEKQKLALPPTVTKTKKKTTKKGTKKNVKAADNGSNDADGGAPANIPASTGGTAEAPSDNS